MKFCLINLLALGLLIGVAIVHGTWSHRWRPFDQRAVSIRLQSVPMIIGNWQGQDAASDDISTWRDDMDTGLIRRYVHLTSGMTMLVLLRGGEPGPIAYHHTPASCYHAVGFNDSRPDIHRPFTDPAGVQSNFWVSTFERSGPSFQRVRVYWGYSGGKGWLSPNNPRVELSSYHVCYKLYAVRNLINADESLDHDPTEQFFHEILPALDAALFSTSASGGDS